MKIVFVQYNNERNKHKRLSKVNGIFNAYFYSLVDWSTINNYVLEN